MIVYGYGQRTLAVLIQTHARIIAAFDIQIPKCLQHNNGLHVTSVGGVSHDSDQTPIQDST